MSNLTKRDIQTRVKHEVLESYLPMWYSIITMGLKGSVYKYGSQFKAKFVYVDCFSFQGRYIDEDSSEEVYGSPIIGVRALDNLVNFAQRHWGIEPETRSILIEESTKNYKVLLETLEKDGLSSRIFNTDRIDQLENKAIAVINGNFLDYTQKLVSLTSQLNTYSFYFIDPYGPSGIPMSAIKPIVAQDHTDTMIHFPYSALHRRTGVAVSDNAEKSDLQKQMLHYDAMYGDNIWRKIAEDYYGELNDARSTEMEGHLLEEYKKRLEYQDNALAVKTVSMKFPNRPSRTLFYLIMTTHDPTGALKLNEVIDNANIRQWDLREERRLTKRGQQSHFFDLVEVENVERPTLNQADINLVMDLIYQVCKKQTCTFKEVLKRLVNYPYYTEDIKDAIQHLKKQNKVSFDSPLNHKSKLVFR